MYYDQEMQVEFTTGDPARTWTQKQWLAEVDIHQGFRLFLLVKGNKFPVAIFTHIKNLSPGLKTPTLIRDHLVYYAAGIPFGMNSPNLIRSYGTRALQELEKQTANSGVN
jgi:hypothetical protein